MELSLLLERLYVNGAVDGRHLSCDNKSEKLLSMQGSFFMKNRQSDQGPFDRMMRGEISSTVAYESSLESIKDSLIARQHQLGGDRSLWQKGRRMTLENPRTNGAPDSALAGQGFVEDEFTTHNPEAVFRLLEIISEIKTAMLTTIDEDMTLRSRPMLTQDYQQDGTLWFFSSDHHGKADELAADPRVNVTYAMPEKQRFISISGLAEIVHDDAKKRDLWKPSFREWFPEGSNDSHLALLKIYIQKAEYWDVPSNQLIEILSFTKAVLTGGTYHTAEAHEKIRFHANPI
jgi:general stress protein 26